MSRFEDFEKLERRVIREALTGAQSEFYDPGHTQEDRDTLEALIREIKGGDLPFTFGGEPTEEPEKPQEPAQDARQEAPECREVYTPTRTRTPSVGSIQEPPGTVAQRGNRLLAHRVRPLRRRSRVLRQAAYHNIPLQ